MMLSVYHTLFQHYALMFLQELQFTGGKRCFCSYLALRDSVGQILPPLQSLSLIYGKKNAPGRERKPVTSASNEGLTSGAAG